MHRPTPEELNRQKKAGWHWRCASQRSPSKPKGERAASGFKLAHEIVAAGDCARLRADETLVDLPFAVRDGAAKFEVAEGSVRTFVALTARALGALRQTRLAGRSFSASLVYQREEVGLEERVGRGAVLVRRTLEIGEAGLRGGDEVRGRNEASAVSGDGGTELEHEGEEDGYGCLRHWRGPPGNLAVTWGEGPRGGSSRAYSWCFSPSSLAFFLSDTSISDMHVANTCMWRTATT